jgi:hypothetical protein
MEASDATTSGMKAGYDAHSEYQRRVIEGGDPLIRSAVAGLDLPPEGEAVTLVDYGAGTGATSVHAMGTAVAALRDRDANRPVLAVHNDVLTNDFTQLFRNVAAPGGYLDAAGGPVFPAAAAGSFFNQVLPAGSVHLGTCSNASHWLREQPSVRVPQGMYFCDATGGAREALAGQAAADWLAFLQARSAELAGEGRLVVQGIGTSEQDGEERVSASRLLRVMWKAADALAAEGRLDPDLLEQYVFPVYCRSAEEAAAPLQSGAELEGVLTVADQVVDEVANPYWEAYERDGDAGAYAKTYVEFVRAFAEPSLISGLFKPAAQGTSPEALSDAYFERLEQLTAAEPEAGRYEAWVLRTTFERCG